MSGRACAMPSRNLLLGTPALGHHGLLGQVHQHSQKREGQPWRERRDHHTVTLARLQQQLPPRQPAVPANGDSVFQAPTDGDGLGFSLIGLIRKLALPPLGWHLAAALKTDVASAASNRRLQGRRESNP